MSAAIVVGILVAAGEAQAPSTVAMLAAATEALGPGASIVLQDSVSPSDHEALRSENQLHAAAVVELFWSDSARTNASIRVHVARGDRWIERRVAFFAGDTLHERGRTLGFTVASILLSETEVLGPRPAPAPPPAQPAVAPQPAATPTPPVASAPPAAPEIAHETESKEPLPSDGAGVDAGAARERKPGTEVEPLAQPFAIDVAVVGSMGLGGPANGLGGATHLEFAVTHTVWVRAGAGVRAGAVPEFGGDDVVAWAAIGGAWRPFVPTETSRFSTAVRLDAGAWIHELSRPNADGTTDHLGRLLPGAVLTLEGAWRAATSLDVFLGLGAEAAFGKTDVFLRTQSMTADRLVANLPPFRGLVEMGVRFHL